MVSFLSDPWNNAVAFLEMRYGDQLLSSGSSFFWAHGARIFLITNWHNLAGRNPSNGKPVSTKTAGIPNTVVFWAYRQITAADSGGFFELKYMPVKVSLEDSTGPIWFEHPHFQRTVDVAALDVTTVVEGFHVRPVNKLEADCSEAPVVSQDIFVVGFPFGRLVNAPAPIWKRGSIALDPSFDPDALPKMFVDTATRKGMSGSVVIARHIIVGRSYTRKDGSASQPVVYAKLDSVVGVYSGRFDDDLEQAQLGIVWKRSLIEEIVVGGRVVNLA